MAAEEDGLQRYRDKARGWGDAARQGESKQRYSTPKDNGKPKARLVAGSVPFRGGRGGKEVEFLLLSSAKHEGTWIFPKGGWETDESCAEAAERETFEEAGVVGDIEERKGKQEEAGEDQKEEGGGGGGGGGGDALTPTPIYVEAYKEGTRKLHMFLLRVELELEEFPEKHRKRRWVSPAEAMLALQSSKAGAGGPLSRALKAACEALGVEAGS